MIKGMGKFLAVVALDTEQNAPGTPGSLKLDLCYITANITIHATVMRCKQQGFICNAALKGNGLQITQAIWLFQSASTSGAASLAPGEPKLGGATYN